MSTSKKLIFKISEIMAKNKKFSLNDIAVLANISMYRENNVTEFRYAKNISETLGISKRTVEKSIATLKSVDAFSNIEKVSVEGLKEKRNKYFFVPLDSQFILASDDIFSSGLTSDEIGFLIKARANTYNNGLTIKGNKENISLLIGVSKGKGSAIINSLNTKGFIVYANSLLTLSLKLFRATCKIHPMLKEYREYAEYAQIIFTHLPKTRMAKMLKYYFVYNRDKIRHPLCILHKIETGVNRKDYTKQEEPGIFKL